MCREPALARRSRLQVQITAGQLDCLFWGTTCCPGVRALFCNLAAQVWFLILVGSGESSILQSFSFPSGQKVSLLWRSMWTEAEFELSLTSLWLKTKTFWHPFCIGLQLSQCCQHFKRSRRRGLPSPSPLPPSLPGKAPVELSLSAGHLFLTCALRKSRQRCWLHSWSTFATVFLLRKRDNKESKDAVKKPENCEQPIKVTFWREKLADLTSDFQASHGFSAQRTEGFLWLADQPLPGKRPGGEILFSFEILSF